MGVPFTQVHYKGMSGIGPDTGQVSQCGAGAVNGKKRMLLHEHVLQEQHVG